MLSENLFKLVKHPRRGSKWTSLLVTHSTQLALLVFCQWLLRPVHFKEIELDVLAFVVCLKTPARQIQHQGEFCLAGLLCLTAHFYYFYRNANSQTTCFCTIIVFSVPSVAMARLLLTKSRPALLFLALVLASIFRPLSEFLEASSHFLTFQKIALSTRYIDLEVV